MRSTHTDTNTETDRPMANAIVLTAPDGCTKYLRHAVAQSLDHMAPGSVLAVPCDDLARLDLVEWCSRAGKQVRNAWSWCDDLLIENSRSDVAAA